MLLICRKILCYMCSSTGFAGTGAAGAALNILGDRLDKSDTDRFRKDDEWYFVWWKGKDLKV